ncbi:MAG: FAD:protein FMN transferase [Phycisphaerae bacterium]|nr:FAD:protein FMN transferase [Phycisphaerae bacterium]
MTEQRQEETCFVRSDCSSLAGMKRFSHEAMATTFEILIVHEDDRYALQAAIAAFNEVDRLEGEFSRFIENSDVSRINNLAAGEPLLLGLDTFECLKISARVNAETAGAFDVTIGSVFQCWRNEDAAPRTPLAQELDLARQRTGMHLLELDETRLTVKLLVSQVQIDLGGVGKGYAVDRAAELLREWSIETALISGGYSSVLALDVPPGTKGWPLTLSHPADRSQILARPHLRAGALSGSGVQKGRHIISPRTAEPTEGKLAAWSGAPDAASADALSTAFMIMTADEIEKYCALHPDTRAMVIVQEQGQDTQKDKILRFGPWKDISDFKSDTL